MATEEKAAEGKKLDAFSLDAGVPQIEGDLRPKPKFADRISNRVIGVAVAVMLVMVGIFFAALDSMDKKNKGKEDSTEIEKKDAPAKTAATGVPKELTEDPSAGDHDAGGSSLVRSPKATNDDIFGTRGGAASLTAGTLPVPTTPGALPAADGLDAGNTAVTTVPPPLTPAQQAELLAQQERAKRLSQARNNGLSAKSYGAEDKKLASAAAGSAAAAKILADMQQQGQAGGFMPTSHGQQAPGKSDSEQDEKLAFLKNGGKDDRDQLYLKHAQQPALSRNELKRGSYVPLRLEGGINSGQPGMVRARVTEDVYDTVTSCRLLVPAMTIVQGTYDSKVAIGQTRNLVVWNYMGFEDGSDLNLGAMQGYDSSGAAGIEADVDNHYMRLFGLAFGMSMITAGVQQSMPDTPTGTTAQTPQQAMATALAQQYGQLGAQILGKYMQVQPTLRNFAGERFMIMLPSTIIFKKVWRTRC
ncbi:hypothetical protein CBP36_21355 (plasmid) [Acidovorax carolinensis]|uniref:Conjugal transfer protein TrbI n=1 Tax=Acidovorax carolinensis TaxID=553814 RepID=A0A240UK75_9BURK|nr:TrbI/VirB10 family protein [Acidovorax carolinensis]ART61515.1 hypothetical protein CBP36_21355 [Acidovorax carolinensis]